MLTNELGRHGAVGGDRSLSIEALLLKAAAVFNPFANGGGIIATVIIAGKLFVVDCRDFDVKIDAIQQGAGNALTVFFDLARRTAALFFRITEVSARAGIHRRDHHELTGKSEFAGGPGDGHLPVLQWLTQDFEGGAPELRQLIEKEDAILGKAYFAR